LQKVEKRKREGKKIRSTSGKTVFVIKFESIKIVIKINKL